MEIKDYNFPKIEAVNRAFPTFDAPEVLVEEAKKRGFYNGDTIWNDLFGEMFYKGIKAGEIDFKSEVKGQEWAEKAYDFAMCLMGSFAPKHEEKEAVCAFIFSETLVWNKSKTV